MNPVYTGMSLSLLWTGTPIVLGTYVARWPEQTDGCGGQPFGSKVASAFRTCMAALQQCAADHLLLTAPAAANRLVPLGPIRVPHAPISGMESIRNSFPLLEDLKEVRKMVSLCYTSPTSRRRREYSI